MEYIAFENSSILSISCNYRLVPTPPKCHNYLSNEDYIEKAIHFKLFLYSTRVTFIYFSGSSTGNSVIHFILIFIMPSQL